MLVRNQDLVISEIPICLRNILLPSFIYPSTATIQVDLFLLILPFCFCQHRQGGDVQWRGGWSTGMESGYLNLVLSVPLISLNHGQVSVKETK